MSSIPLFIGVPEDSCPQNEGDRQKTLLFIIIVPKENKNTSDERHDSPRC